MVRKGRRVRALALLGAALLVALLGLAALPATETGTRWLVTLLEKTSGEGLRAQRVSGALTDTLRLEQVTLRAPAADIEALEIALSWTPEALLRGTLAFRSVEARGVTVSLREQAEDRPEDPATLSSLAPPLPLEATDIVIRDLVVRRSGAAFPVDVLRASLSAGRALHAVVKAKSAPPGGSGEVEAEIRGAWATGEYHADLSWRALLADGTRLAGTGDVDGTPGEGRIHHRLTAPFEASTRGSVTLAGAVPVFRLEGEWREARWPLAAPRVRSAAGRYTLHGPWEAMDLRIEGDLAAEDLPPARLVLSGRLPGWGALHVEESRLETLDGHLDARGRIHHRPHLGWDLTLNGEGLNPGAHWPPWEGALHGRVRVRGDWRDKVPQTRLEIDGVGGELRGYPVAVEGGLRWTGDGVEAQGLLIRSGPNRLSIEGRFEPTLDASFVVEADDLSAVLPDAQGRLSGDGHVAGSWTAPRLTLRLSGADLHHRDRGAGVLEVDAEVAAEPAPSRILVRVEDARIGERRAEVLELRAEGRLAAHRAHASVRAGEDTLEFALAGGLEAGRWDGEIRELEWSSLRAGTWRLSQAVGLRGGADRIEVENACLNSEAGARACGAFERGDEDHATLALSGVPLALLSPWLPDPLSVSGRLDAEADLRIRGDEVAGTVSARASPGEIVLTREEDDALVLPHAGTEARLALEGGGAALELSTTLDGEARIQASVAAERLSGDAALSGTIEADLPRLGIAALGVPGVRTIDGRARFDGRLAGSLAAPRIEGRTRIDIERALVRHLGTELGESSLEIHFDDAHAALLRGTLSAGGGHLAVNGRGRLEPDSRFAVDLRVSGESFEALRLPHAHILVSPDLVVRGGVEALDVQGRVLIPRATIAPRHLVAGAVRVSSDEVLVDGGGRERVPEALSGPEVVVELSVELGDEVVFDGFGITSRLTGTLQVLRTPGAAPTVYGDVHLVEGRFGVYGQHLEIEQGRLIFTGSLDNPGLDIRAVRRTREVTAGLRIEGTAHEPRSQVFSEPALGEAEALAYLITGQALSAASGSEAALLTQAALSLGLGETVLSGLPSPSEWGLDELRVDPSGKAGEATLILGKQLTPDLSVRYALGLFGHADALLLNYRLNEHLSLEAETGAQPGLDLLLRIERDRVLPE